MTILKDEKKNLMVMKSKQNMKLAIGLSLALYKLPQASQEENKMKT